MFAYACFFDFVVSILQELLEICISHSCAWVYRAMAMCLAGFGSCLHVMAFGGSSL